MNTQLRTSILTDSGKHTRHPRLHVAAAKVPQHVATDISKLASETGTSRSDFILWCLVRGIQAAREGAE